MTFGTKINIGFSSYIYKRYTILIDLVELNLIHQFRIDLFALRITASSIFSTDVRITNIDIVLVDDCRNMNISLNKIMNI